jgi:formamidopyrimidine-DNA glycosylase
VPEILEVEFFRRAAEHTVGRKVRTVSHVDPLVVEDGLAAVIVDRRVVGVRRHGKVLTMDLGTRASKIDVSIDLHFGMSGRIIVDGHAPIGELTYGASDDDRWLRFGLRFDRGWMAISDPRRFARVSFGRDGVGLGPDAFTVNLATFRQRLSGRRGPVKAVLLDQSVIAGLGNMLVDEILWRVDIDPRRSVAMLDPSDVARVHVTMRRVLAQLDRRGGSHTGDLSVEHRRPGECCPRDGATLERSTVGGRTTFWCPAHQT